MDNLTEKALAAIKDSQVAYCKFITPNDVGITGGHQAGYHIHKNGYKLAFDRPGERGNNLEKFVTIKWQDDFETESRFIYYGQGTRNEYRLTRFGRDFPFLNDDDIGSVLIICRKEEDYYLGFVLGEDQQIDDFLAYFDLSPANTNGIIKDLMRVTPDLETEFKNYIRTLDDGPQFPSTEEISQHARAIIQKFNNRSSRDAISNPDKELVSWIDTEYKLFKAIEEHKYSSLVSTPSGNVESLVTTANMVLNRRKSRAGKSLEHHLAYIFDANSVKYTPQGQTEGKHKPDFIMPSIQNYHLANFPADKLTFLGAKTTCKDRWRQVLSQADRIPRKHLFTLQPGISSNQLKEMKKANLTLVVPAESIVTFPAAHRADLMSLVNFISYVKDK